ncbi:HTH-type transcriptional regulator MgrA [Pseudovibrio axinellae]|uniref:HTH-type transcriptional regulator MgrA n=1 Tax=Pseudovibrio axinellae TaxID=989403 RepID=A0A165SYZ1_9HYPH|nr:MarR family winged helix-turn-helix transcriptional regulator [Pseudovibrio axinellae]KZL05046.1 HTH-type transcriptional regulator MgrA [Pseudovibrio axinellae]SER65849.1 transcriptional regulator [Pseudovibrio axinellae]
MSGDELENFTPYLLNRIMARYNMGVEQALKAAGVSVPQMRTLTVLDKRGPCTINELSVLTVINQSTLSRTLDALEDLDCVRRETDANDSRIRRIHLTENGRELCTKTWPKMKGMEETMLASLTQEQRQEFNSFLKCILHDIRCHEL